MSARAAARRSLGAIALMLLCARAPAAAADDVVAHGTPGIRAFGEEDGLPQSTITGMAFDAAGRLWVGTQAGPAWFDGRRWTPLRLPDEVKSSWIYAVAATADGAVWFGTEDGLLRYRDERFTRFTEEAGLPSSQVVALAEQRAGGGAPTLWAGTDRGLARLEGERWVRVELGPSLASAKVLSIREGALEPGEAALWVGTNAGLARCAAGVCAPFATRATGLPEEHVFALLDTASAGGGGRRTLWVGTEGGLARYEDGRWESFAGAGSPIPPYPIWALAETTSGSGERTLWVGTYGGGLARLRRGVWKTLSAESAGLPVNYVHALLPASGASGARVLWIGTDGGGVARLRHDGWVAFTRGAGLPGLSVSGFAERAGEGGAAELWLGVDGGVARWTGSAWASIELSGAGVDVPRITALFRPQDEPGSMLIGTEGGGLRRWTAGGLAAITTTTSPLPNDHIYALSGSLGGRATWIGTHAGAARLEGDAWEVMPRDQVFDGVGDILETARPGGGITTWFATRKGLVRRDGERWQSYTAATSPLRGDYIASLSELRDPRGARVLWIGTVGAGVARYDLDAEAWLQPLDDRSQPALPDSTVNQIRADARGRVYLFTNRGVARLTPRRPTPEDPAEHAIYTFTTEDGLPSNETNSSGSFVDSRGRIWAGTIAGAAVFDPAEEIEDTTPKPLVVSQARAAGGAVEILPGTALRWDQNTVAFEYALLSLFRERDTLYRAQLVGFDPTPGEWTADTKAKYTNLPAGEYSFLVWARDYAGNVAGPASVAFRVRTAPWRAWWAWLGYAAVVAAAGYGAHRARLRALSQRTRELEARVQERTAELDHKNEELDRKNAELALNLEELDSKVAELARKNRELEESHRRADRIFSALADVLPGTTLDGKYRLEERIGSGGFGAVFRSTHLALGRPVAVKIFRPTPGNDAAIALERFRREGLQACRVNHPNAIQVLDSGISREGIAYLVMEMLAGRSLAEELRRQGRLPLRRAARILSQVCAALEAAHQSGVIHRDVKPDNIFLHRGPEGEAVKVVDFGIAKLTGMDQDDKHLTATGAILGTPSYMAPERFLKGPDDARSDIFSVGVTAFEMVSGALPWPIGESTMLELVMRQLSQPPADLAEIAPWLPADAARTVMRCLAKAPDERPSLADLARELERAAASLPEEALSLSPGSLAVAQVSMTAETVEVAAPTMDASTADASTASAITVESMGSTMEAVPSAAAPSLPAITVRAR